MSAREAEGPTVGSEAATTSCARCGAPLGPEDFACTECGLPVVPRMTVAWKRPSRSRPHDRSGVHQAPSPAPSVARRSGAGLPAAVTASRAAGGERLTPGQRVVRAVPLGPAMESRRAVRRAMLIAMHALALTGFVGLAAGAFLLGRLLR